MDKKVKIQKTGRFWQENFTKKWCRNTLQFFEKRMLPSGLRAENNRRGLGFVVRESVG